MRSRLAACIAAALAAAASPLAAQAPPRIRLVKDTNPGSDHGSLSRFERLGSLTLFAAFDPVHGDELWVTDGTTDGTALVKDVDPHGNGVPTDLAGMGPTAIGSIALFAGDDSLHGRELWRTDGTAAGTTIVEDIVPGPDSGLRFGTFVAWNDVLYFTARTAIGAPPQLWRSDGTADGTYALSSHPDWEDSFRGVRIVVHGDRLVYTTDRNRFVWSTDGTVPGTLLVKDLGPAAPFQFYDIPDLVSVGRYVYFAAAGAGGTGWEPWRTDGTAAGTVLVKDLAPGAASSTPVDMRVGARRNRVTFIASDGVHGHERWITDGTAAGTRMLKDIVDGPEGSTSPEGGELATLVSGALVFSAYTPGLGFELWVSDGSPAGTTFLEDVQPGATSGLDEWVKAAAAGGDVYFRGDDGVHGAELWRSDGTAAGTHMVEDTLDGGIPSLASPEFLNGSTLFLGAWHWETGFELYAYDLPSLSVAGWRGVEGAGAAELVVTIDGPAEFPIEVHYETVDQTATAGYDYRNLSGTLTFPGPETSQTIHVPIVDDRAAEGAETFALTLSAPRHAVLRTASATAVIADDDGVARRAERIR